MSTQAKSPWTHGISRTRPSLIRRSLYAKNDWSDNAVEIELGYNFPGSPPPAFGFDGTEPQEDRRWPVVNVKVSLPCKREDLREELARELQATIDAFIEKHGLG